MMWPNKMVPCDMKRVARMRTAYCTTCLCAGNHAPRNWGRQGCTRVVPALWQGATLSRGHHSQTQGHSPAPRKRRGRGDKVAPAALFLHALVVRTGAYCGCRVPWTAGANGMECMGSLYVVHLSVHANSYGVEYMDGLRGWYSTCQRARSSEGLLLSSVTCLDALVACATASTI